jgi:hypothetical protein
MKLEEKKISEKKSIVMGKIWRGKRRKKARALGLGATHVVNPLLLKNK